ncbi:MAG: outer membrane protein transport protein [Candidatus Cloacimonetes bacterium]|nr:outer membrane protein transport protein [Candidatus Cloacimonadota bacterium]
MAFVNHSFSRGLLCAALLAPASVMATNGMDNEGYGPISTAMGGAGQAFDNGSAAVMNNPATITLMTPGSSRLDLALGMLQPKVRSSMNGMPTADSAADRFIMPAMGYLRSMGSWTLGAGVFAQGGMGTDYEKSSFLSAGSGNPAMSQVGVGRFSVPVGYRMNEKLGLGMTMDYVWANMDVEMAMAGAGQFASFISSMGGSQALGSASGSMVDALGGAVMAGQLSMPSQDYASNPMAAGPVNWAHFSFCDDSDFTGQATGGGMAMKLGALYTVSDQWTVGLSYHGATALSDLEADGACMSMSANFDDALLAQQWNGIPEGAPGIQGAPAGSYSAVTVPVSGKITVKDFQWPAQMALGLAYRPSQAWLVAMDLKQIGWSSVMENFNLSFKADATQANPMAMGFAGTAMDMTLKQNWDDQLVMALGAAFAWNEDLTLRFGFNHASNPVPDQYLNPLFPAIVENHYTLGAGYRIGSHHQLNGSMQLVPEAKNTSASGVVSTHSQTNFQLMYSFGF